MIDLSGAGDLVAAAWRADRAYLIDLAYRMLGDIGAAEDVVQEAFLRLDLAEPGEVRDPRGWLTVVTSRLCLDRIRSAHNRRERPSDTAWLDSALSLGRQTVVDPADRVTLDEEVSEALLILLQRLSPAERVSFVLHDVFQLPFDQVAEILGKPSATCRQLAKRARAKVAGGPHTTKSEMADHELHKISQTFLAACANGDLEALTAVLHEQVWGVADFTAGDPPQLRPRRSSQQVQRGADRIARSLLRLLRRQRHPRQRTRRVGPCLPGISATAAVRDHHRLGGRRAADQHACRRQSGRATRSQLAHFSSQRMTASRAVSTCPSPPSRRDELVLSAPAPHHRPAICVLAAERASSSGYLGSKSSSPSVHWPLAFISPSLTLPVLNGRPALGTWQSVVLVDTNADNPDRRVRLSVVHG